jgi:DNA-binding MarR family transcriptional regulator
MESHTNFGFLLKDVARLYTRRFEERAQALCLTLAQCKALAVLAKNEGVSQKRLAELSEIDPMSLVRILDRMEADGWVERRSDPEDRRARSLVVTERARPIIDQFWQVAGATRAEAFAGLAAAERTALVELLDRVHTNLIGLKPLTEREQGAASARKSASASQ